LRFLRTGEKAFDRYLLELEKRAAEDGGSLEQEVQSILEDVRRRGDRALLRYSRIFDGLRLQAEQLQLGAEEVREAYRRVPEALLGTLKKAVRRIRAFHQIWSREVSKELAEKGIRLTKLMRPLERVGIYVPGGKASYPSTVLMASIPARIAGVKEIVMVTPPHRDGISPAIIVAADLGGIDRIFRIGGAQAIAALAYGTASVPRVDKIVGPGNRYVTAAKRLVYGAVDIDMVAGPSEIVIVSDEKTPAVFLAADLIAQAEHDERALAVLITPSEALGTRVAKEINDQLSRLERRAIAQAALGRKGAILIVKDLHQAMELVNRIAPEHLELAVSKPQALVRRLKHAGAVFIGSYTPVVIGDYLAGPNHILPTAGTARFSSPLGVEDFVKRINLIGFSQEALASFREDLKRFTEWEGLQGHYQSVLQRTQKK